MDYRKKEIADLKKRLADVTLEYLEAIDSLESL